MHVAGMVHRNLDVLDAAARVSDDVGRLIDRSPRTLLHVRQLRDSAQAIAANIAEGFGRGTTRDRARLLRIARGEAEEAIQHLGANFRLHRISTNDYWAIHHRLVVIVKMINSFLSR